MNHFLKVRGPLRRQFCDVWENLVRFDVEQRSKEAEVGSVPRGGVTNHGVDGEVVKLAICLEMVDNGTFPVVERVTEVLKFHNWFLRAGEQA